MENSLTESRKPEYSTPIDGYDRHKYIANDNPGLPEHLHNALAEVVEAMNEVSRHRYQTR